MVKFGAFSIRETMSDLDADQGPGGDALGENLEQDLESNAAAADAVDDALGTNEETAAAATDGDSGGGASGGDAGGPAQGGGAGGSSGGREILPVNIEDELRQSYLDYAMSVIVGRALPDVRDGLKPVHRRVLFTMNELNNTFNRPYMKSARVVGDVMGKYHPHGDSAIYDTAVRMAQAFAMRYQLVDGQGNFGSVDGDPPAAMRYTEIRMTKLASELLADLDKETVEFVPNYDDTLTMPTVLPTRVPNLLVNGSSGIAVGMATNIPPHNLREVVDGCLALLDDPEPEHRRTDGIHQGSGLSDRGHHQWPWRHRAGLSDGPWAHLCAGARGSGAGQPRQSGDDHHQRAALSAQQSADSSKRSLSSSKTRRSKASPNCGTNRTRTACGW